MKKLQETQNPQSPHHEETENLNRHITCEKIQPVIKNLLKNKKV